MKRMIKASNNMSDFVGTFRYKGDYSISPNLVSKSQFMKDLDDFLASSFKNLNINNVIVSDAKVDSDEIEFDEGDRIYIEVKLSANNKTTKIGLEYEYYDDKFYNVDNEYDRTDWAYEIAYKLV